MKQIRDSTGRIAFRYTRFEKIRAIALYGFGLLLLLTIAETVPGYWGIAIAASAVLAVGARVHLGEILEYNKMVDDLANYKATGSSLHLYDS